MSSTQLVQQMILEARLEHADAIAELFDSYRQFYGRTADRGASRRFIEDRIKDQSSTLFLALHRSQPAGFAQLYPTFSSLQMRRAFVLNDLFVAPRFRKRGLARELLSEVTEWSCQRKPPCPSDLNRSNRFQ